MSTDLPTYSANTEHHRASLLTNLKWLHSETNPARGYAKILEQCDRIELVRKRIRRDIESLGGLAGQW